MRSGFFLAFTFLPDNSFMTSLLNYFSSSVTAVINFSKKKSQPWSAVRLRLMRGGLYQKPSYDDLASGVLNIRLNVNSVSASIQRISTCIYNITHLKKKSSVNKKAVMP